MIRSIYIFSTDWVRKAETEADRDFFGTMTSATTVAAGSRRWAKPISTADLKKKQRLLKDLF